MTRDDQSDQTLIEAARSGSAAAWETLVRRHESRIYNFCRRFSATSDDAVDLMQEVFLGVYRNLDKFRGESQFSTWLFRIAHNKAIDLARRRHSEPPSDSVVELSDDLQVTDQAIGPEESLGASQQNRRIQLLLAQLPAEQRLTLELKFYQELTFDDISVIENISPNTAKTRYYAALKKLKELMEGTQ